MSPENDDKDWSFGAPRPAESEYVLEVPRRSRFLAVIFVLLVLTGVLSRFLWGFVRSDAFPKLPPGKYAGTFSGDAEFAGVRNWLLNISDDYKNLEAIFLGIDGMGNPAQRNGSGYLVIQTAEQNLILKGASGNNQLRGTFEIEGSRRSGEWTLEPITRGEFEADQAFRHWMVLRSEIAKVERDAQVAEQLIPAQKSEIEELSKTITDESALKDRRIKRAKELQERLNINQAALSKAQKDVAQAETQLRLAQKVSVKGKLVALARDSLERETRWARSVLAGSPGVVSGELDAALIKAREIQTLKEALAIESASVEQLSRELEARGDYH